MFDRLPTPFGLVRYGVAPDAQSTKQIARVFDRTAQHQAFRFLGNVEVGRDIKLDELRRFYDAVILAVGSDSHRRLGVPGEDLPECVSANDFVGWYNGHPDYAERKFDLSHRTAVIVGSGNVAMDVARMLAKSPAELEQSDISEAALAGLRESGIRDIHLVARRGPVQAAFSYTELTALAEIDDGGVVVDGEDLVINEQSEEELQDPSEHNRVHNLELLRSYSGQDHADKRIRTHLRFRLSPVEIAGTEHVTGVVLERNELVGEAGAQHARGTGERDFLSCGLVISCIGYRGVAMPGVPFDDRTGTVPNEGGRVKDKGAVVPGLYASGWIRRGPEGLVASSKKDAQEVVANLFADAGTLSLCEEPDTEALCRLLRGRGVEVVDYQGWKRLDGWECEQGAARGRPRVKVLDRAEMLRISLGG
jgi:ferredoxin--NADP+ reductase